MSIAFSQGKLQGQERKKVLQAVQEQAKIAASAAVKLILEAFLEAEVSVKLGREKGEARLTGSVGPVDVATPIASSATAITADSWKQAGAPQRFARSHAGVPGVSA